MNKLFIWLIRIFIYFILFLIKPLLWFKSRKHSIERYLSKKSFFVIENSPKNLKDFPDKISVAAVQMELSPITSARAYIEKIYNLTRKAVEKDAQMIIFPEDTATPLLALMPGIKKLAEAVGQGDEVRESSSAMEEAIEISKIFKVSGEAVRRVYEATFSKMAREFGVYIIAGSAVLPEKDGSVYNSSYFYDFHGNQIGRQFKLHLFPMEEDWGLKPGHLFEIYETIFGKLAILVCMDATYFEPARIAALKGVDLLVTLTCDPDFYNYYKQIRGLWSRVQENCLYGIESGMIGQFLGMTFQRKSAIYAPLELTERKDGIIREAESYDREEIVVTDLDLKKIREYREKIEWGRDFNLEIIEKYLPKVYPVL